VEDITIYKDIFNKYYIADTNYICQKKLEINVKYNSDYIRNNYEKDIIKLFKAKKLNKLRWEFINSYITINPVDRLLDFGCGSGTFLTIANKYCNAVGYDINDHKIKAKKIADINYPKKHFRIVTFFDSLEHTVCPEHIINVMYPKYIIISIPECNAIKNIYNNTYDVDYKKFIEWKHRKYGEHLYHFNRFLLDKFMNKMNYKCLIHSNFEDLIRKPINKFESNILSAIYKRMEE